ncbi:MAG: hypothetical protein JWN40_3406 [Phycisphaerales bacterium]|nr:hypothetical protein [Phycisphaerales bacterium]
MYGIHLRTRTIRTRPDITTLWDRIRGRTAETTTIRVEQLVIIDIEERKYGPGKWVTGWIDGFDFEALVFAEHALRASYEIDQSRISKLCLRDHQTQREAYHWDRGLDYPAQNKRCKAAVECLAQHLAEIVFPSDGDPVKR